ncbi:MAG TPA: hypothetical protein VHT52_10830 [Stellaceae bacterium]|jgi:hypothetical protein|nr:hypothetical protein [Stellaceae bacterium]
MPKQAPPIASDDEINSFLKERNWSAPGAAPGTAPAAAPDTKSAAAPDPGGPGPLTRGADWLHDQAAQYGLVSDAPQGRAPNYDEMNWSTAMGQGAAREAAATGLGINDLAMRHFIPSPWARSKLEELSSRIPGMQRLRDFAQGESEGPAESVGAGLTDIATGAFVPELGIGKTLGNIVATPMFKRGVGWVTNPAGSGALARYAGSAAEMAGKGALGGAVTDPDDPTTGAAAGAGAALGGRVVGKALSSGTGKAVGGAIARNLPAMAAGAAMGHGSLLHEAAGGALGGLASEMYGGVRHSAQHGLRSYHSPLARYLTQVGRAVFDRTGRFLGYRPVTAGMMGGHAAAGTGPAQDPSGFWSDMVGQEQQDQNPYTEQDYGNEPRPQGQ